MIYQVRSVSVYGGTMTWEYDNEHDAKCKVRARTNCLTKKNKEGCMPKAHNKLFNWFMDEPLLDDLDEELEDMNGFPIKEEEE